ncbi:unnamed protein product [Trifolium pratense]|uniref:Uncharacterized protein n=1 Tax=Trifolium pratense TaxID=57577 RepID=A0ACB0JBY3_TRIPR|nr:unnamed protein product [Trifolium pratense]
MTIDVGSWDNKICVVSKCEGLPSRGRLVAGSFQGYTDHVDGKPSDARFNHPKGISMDDKGNVYVADTQNLAIRKIGDSGVTTIAGEKSNVVGYRDGPSEDAKFSNDFDVVYIRPTYSLLVIDRGNAALRKIILDQDDCDYQSSSISITDLNSYLMFAMLVSHFVDYYENQHSCYDDLHAFRSCHIFVELGRVVTSNITGLELK